LTDKIKVFPYIEYEPEGYAICVAYSPDGKFIAIGNSSGTVDIMDENDIKIIKKLSCGFPVYAVEWSPDSKYLATGGFEGSVNIWEVENWSLVKNLGEKSEALTISWSSNGDYLVAGNAECSDDRPYIDIWSTVDWKRMEIKVSHPFYVAFNPDSSYLAIQYDTIGIEILSVPEFKRVKLLDLSDTSDYALNISSPAWSANGSYIGACTHEGKIRIWRCKDWSIVTTKQLHNEWDEGEYRIAFCPNNKFLVSGGVGHPKIISMKTWEVIYEIEDVFSEDNLDFSWHPSGKYLAIVSSQANPFAIWEII